MRQYRENWSACNGGDMSPPYGWEYGGVVQWIARVEMQVRVLPLPAGIIDLYERAEGCDVGRR